MKIFKADGNSIYLIAAKYTTYTIQQCYYTNNTYQCYTKTVTDAGNVLSFKINLNGTIEWSTLIKRSTGYSGVVDNDMSLFLYNNKIYGFIPALEPINFNEIKDKKQRKAAMKEASKMISYAVIDGSNGNVSVKKQRIGLLSDNDKKIFYYNVIKGDDEKNLFSVLYYNTMEKKQRMLVYAYLSCIIIPPAGLIAIPIIMLKPIQETINLCKITIQ